MKKLHVLLGIFLALSFASCVSDSKAPPPSEEEGVPMIQVRRNAEGEQLFKTYCTRCHNPKMEKPLTGPGLYGIKDRAPSEEWIRKFIRNSQEMIQSGDEYAVKMYESSSKSFMDPFPNLTEAEMDSLLDYIYEYQPDATQ